MPMLLEDAIKNIYTYAPSYYDWNMRCMSVERYPSLDTLDDDAYIVEIERYPKEGTGSRIFTDTLLIPRVNRGSVNVKGRSKQGFYTALGNYQIRIGDNYFHWGHSYTRYQQVDVHWRLNDEVKLIDAYNLEAHKFGDTLYSFSYINLLKYFDLWDSNLIVYFSSDLYNKSLKTLEKDQEEIQGFIETCVIPEGPLKKLRFLTKDAKLSDRVSKEVVQAFLYITENSSVLKEQPTPMDYKFLNVYEAMAEELSRPEVMRSVRSNTCFSIELHSKFTTRYLQTKIGDFMVNKKDPDDQGGSSEFSNIQSATDTNALSVAEQNSKVYFEVWKKDAKGKGSSGYVKQRLDPVNFVGMIDPVFTSDGNMVNIKNELSKSAVIRDGDAYVKVLDLEFNEVELPIYDYLMSPIISGDNIDYAEKRVFPTQGTYSIYQYGEYHTTDTIPEGAYLRMEDSILTTSTSMIPFINKTESMRAMLGGHMYTQAMPVIGSKKGFIYTGEGKKIYDNTALNASAPISGEITAISDGFVRIDDGEQTKVVARPRSYNTSNHSTNLFSLDNWKVGDKVKEGQTIYTSNSFKDKELALAVPLYTAFTSWHAREHEDAVVLSESAAKKFGHEAIQVVTEDLTEDNLWAFGLDYVKDVVTDTDKFDTLGIIKVGTQVRRGDPIFVHGETRGKNSALARTYKDITKTDLMNLIVVTCPYVVDDGVVESIEFVPKISYKSDKNLANREDFKTLYQYFNTLNVNYLADNARELGIAPKMLKDYTMKSEVFAHGVLGKIRISIRYVNKLKVTDKISNLYGGKGVVSTIVPDDKMLRDSNGKVIDIVMSPLAVISRINISQLYMANLGLIAREMYKRLDLFLNSDRVDTEEERLLKDIVSKLYYETPDITLEKVFNENSFEDGDGGFIRFRVSALDKHFTSELIEEMLIKLGINDHDTLYDPTTQKYIRTPIRVGYQDFIRLHFIAENKMKATGTRVSRGLTGYGDTRKRGQSIGEQESQALLAHGQQDLLRKFSSEDKAKPERFFQEMLSIGLILNKKD